MKRTRDTSICFRATEEERALIDQKMKLSGIRSLRAYMLKMAIDGYTIQLDLSSVQDMVSLLRNATNNLNQIAKRVNETGGLYAADIEDLRRHYDGLWAQADNILRKLSLL